MATVGILGGVGLVGLGIRTERMSQSAPLAGTISPTPVSSTTPTLAPVKPANPKQISQDHAKRVKALNIALKKFAATVPEFSVAVLDRTTGQRYSYRGTQSYETASVVKVQVLACLLLTRQRQHRSLSSTELALAQRMISQSDNDATTSLFDRLGGPGAIQACDKRLGLTQTKVNGAWGLTRTTVNDQVKLLAQLVEKTSLLNAHSRQLAVKLMGMVDDEQNWGVPAIARANEAAIVKNGWLARSVDHNHWIVNTVGRVTGARTDVSVAVLSRHHKSMPGGIAAVEKAAKLTRQYLKY